MSTVKVPNSVERLKFEQQVICSNHFINLFLFDIQAREEEEQRRQNCSEPSGVQFPSAPVHIATDNGSSGGFQYSPTSVSTPHKSEPSKQQQQQQQQNHIRPPNHHHRHGSSGSGKAPPGSSNDPNARSGNPNHRHGKSGNLEMKQRINFIVKQFPKCEEKNSELEN